MKFWHKLSLNTTDAINKEFSFERLLKERQSKEDAPIYLWNFTGNELNNLFNIDWLVYLKDNGLEIGITTIFYRQGAYKQPFAHTDTNRDPRLISQIKLPSVINFVLNDDDGEMIWYDFPDSIGESVSYGNTYGGWTKWPIDGLNVIDQVKIGNQLTLVRVDQPHSVIMGPKPRFAISMRTLQERYGWEDSVNSLKHLIV